MKKTIKLTAGYATTGQGAGPMLQLLAREVPETASANPGQFIDDRFIERAVPEQSPKTRLTI